MKRKRLKHAADIICQMLCGWRLMNDHESLTSLASGILEANLITQKCFYNGKEIEPLKIVGEINHWLKTDLEANHIPIEKINEATLKAEFNIRFLEGKRKAPERWSGNPKKYLACDIRCESRIETKEKIYSSLCVDYEEWPLNWWKN